MRCHLITWDVWSQSALDNALEEGPIDVHQVDPGRWLPIHTDGSGAGYRDMQAFISDRDDDHAENHLGQAISGRGPSGGSRTPRRHGPV